MALLDEQTGRPARALRILARLTDLVDERWQPLIHLARGRCYEATWNEIQATDSYHRALGVEPAAVVPRLAAAKLRMRRNPQEAIDELRHGLKQVPDDPALLTALAGALLQLQLPRPVAERSWTEFDAAFAKAAAVTPGSSAVALMKVDRLALSGQEDASLRSLEESAKALPHSTAVAVSLADTLTRRGRTADALAALETCLGPQGGWRSRVAPHRSSPRPDHHEPRPRRPRCSGPRHRPAANRGPHSSLDLPGPAGDGQGRPADARRAYQEWSRLAPEDPPPAWS